MYFIKGQMHVKDQYYDEVSEQDIFLIKKSILYTAIAPFAGALFMSAFFAFKDRFSMSKNYQYRVDMLKDKYIHKESQYESKKNISEQDEMTALEKEELQKLEAVEIRKAYDTIKNKEMADKEFGAQKIRDQNA